MGVFVAFLLILIVGGAVWAVITINGFTAKQMKIFEARSGIEVALTKRYDVLQKLLEVAKGYMNYEFSAWLQTIRLRTGMTMGEIYEAENRLDDLTERVQAVAERYPVLTSSQVFRELQYGITDTEQHLEAARRVYNSNVQIYNTAISRFPARLLAGRRKQEPFFYAKQGVHTDLKMTF